MSANTAPSVSPGLGAPVSRWFQLIVGVGCMVAASNIQYSWTLFVPEIQEAHGGPVPPSRRPSRSS